MDNEQLVKFCTEFAKLKQQLKCPICLEIIQETAELQCGHKLCAICYNTQKGTASNQVNQCPLCKTAISRRSLVYKDEFADKLGCVVTKICTIIEQAKNCTIEELVHYHGQPIIRKTHNYSKKIKSDRDQYKLKEKVKSAEEFSTDSRISDHLKQKRSDSGIKPHISIHETTTSKDHFDALMVIPQEFTINKKGTRLKYEKKQKEKDENYKILPFKNSSTRTSVLGWLNDNKNKFDRLTQTQCFIGESEEIPTEDLISVSQIHPKGTKLLDNTIKKRAKSFSYDSETEKPKEETSRLSDLGLKQNYCSIEEFDTEYVVLKKAEKNVILNIMEDEVLNKMEKDLEECKQKNVQKEQQTTQSSTSGWERIQNISNTLRKRGRNPKKLNITLQNNSLNKPSSRILKDNSKNAKTETSLDDSSRVEITLDHSFNKSTNESRSTKNNSGIKPPKREKDMSDSTQNSNKENIEDSSKACDKELRITILSDVIVHNADTNDGRNSRCDAKKESSVEEPKAHTSIEKIEPQPETINDDSAVKSATKLEESPPSDFHKSFHQLNTFVDVMKELRSKMDNCMEKIDNNKPIKKRDLENIREYLEKLDDLHDCKVEKKIAEVSLQTELSVADAYTQTEKVEHCEIDVQTSGICCENYNNAGKSTRSSKKDHEIQPSVEMNKSLENIQNDDFGATLDLVNLETRTKSTQSSRRDLEIRPSVEMNESFENFRNDDFGGTLDLVNLETRTKSTQSSKKDLEIRPSVEMTKSLENIQNDDFGASLDMVNFKTRTRSTQSSKRDHEIPLSVEMNKSLKNIQNDDFGATLDMVNFETQDVLDQYLQKHPKEPSVKLDVQKEIATNNSPTHQNNVEEPNVLICSLKSDGENKNKGSATFKRCLSDSDSSDVVVPKRRCNRFIRDDLSIEFDATEKIETQKNRSLPKVLSPETDEENDEVYLDKILKKYENGGDLDASDHLVTPRKDANTDELCADIVANVSENVEKLARLNETAKSTNKTGNGLDDDNLFLNDDNLSKLDVDMRLHRNSFEQQTQYSDIIAETESMEPLPKKMKLRNLNKGLDKQKLSGKAQDQPIKVDIILPSPTEGKENVCQELDDSLDDAHFENIQIEEEVKKNTLIRQDFPKLNEDDLFSDEDVVETTPQKEKCFAGRRSQLSAVNLSLFPAQDKRETPIDEEFDIDFAPLAPPPGFEDDNETTAAEEEVTVINLKPIENQDNVSTTPDRKSKMNFACSTPNALNISLHKAMHSTPITQSKTQAQTLGLSPIVHEKSIFETCSSDKTIVPVSNSDNQKKNNILTSDPRQKSILNYVRSSESSAAPKRKPCIACTRLNKQQIQSVSLLANKKLTTYSAKFNDSITHMIVSVDDNKKIKDYTMKLVCAMAAGIWILEFGWIKECLKKNAIVPEEPFEALDDAGGRGPNESRLSKKRNSFFKGFQFFVHSPLFSTTVEELEDVITKLGGETVRNLESLVGNNRKICLIITEARATQDFEIYERWLEKYKLVTVDIEWLSKSIGQHRILSVRPHIWCSDDTLDDLGYPPYLIEDAQCSSSEAVSSVRN